MTRMWIIAAAVAIVAFSATGIYAWQRAKSSSVVSPDVASSISPTPVPQTLLLWDDPAGFTFQYPEGLVIDTHDEDQEHYAHIEFTSVSHPGSVIVWAKDTTAVDSAEWVKSQKTLKEGSTLDSTLGGLAGTKVIVTAPERRMVTATVDDSIVFYIEGTLTDADYWTSVYGIIADSFAFTPLPGEVSAAGPAADGDMVDEEEIIE